MIPLRFSALSSQLHLAAFLFLIKEHQHVASTCPLKEPWVNTALFSPYDHFNNKQLVFTMKQVSA